MHILRIVQHTMCRALVTVAPQPQTYVLCTVVYASTADTPSDSMWLVIAHV